MTSGVVIRALVLKSRGLGFEAFTLPVVGFVPR